MKTVRVIAKKLYTDLSQEEIDEIKEQKEKDKKAKNLNEQLDRKMER